MNILLVHNFYKQKGGEYSVFKNELNLLKAHGHNVTTYTRDNDVNDLYMFYEFLFNCTWSNKTFNEVSAILRKKDIDVIHVHNFFPLISPSVFYAAKDCGVKSVFTLHNYRIFDPGALLLHKGSIDETPLTNFDIMKFSKERRYRDSFLQTFRVAKMIDYHKSKKTWQERVDKFIVLTSFAKAKFIEAGLPPKKIFVKPNFIEDPIEKYPALKTIEVNSKSGFIYVGRISREKGISTLIQAWQNLSNDIPLYILGDGPLLKDLVKKTEKSNHIRWLGYQSEVKVYERIKKSKALILPSVCYEGFPMTILEAFALSTPVITSDIGGQSSIVEPRKTGHHFELSNSKDLRELVIKFNSDSRLINKLGRNARKVYQEKYNPEVNYGELISIYEKLLDDQTEF